MYYYWTGGSVTTDENACKIKSRKNIKILWRAEKYGNTYRNGTACKNSRRPACKTGITERNNALKAAADALLAKRDTIQAANAKDIEAAKKNQMKPAMIDRLTLTDARIEGMAEGLYQIVQLDDPIGEITSMKQRPNGLMIGKKRCR